MGKLTLFMHLSLDGFGAALNGQLDWVHVDDEIFDDGAKRIYATDIAVYGRNTYQLMEGYWPTAADQPNPTKHDLEHSKWYKQVKKVVLSKTLKEEYLLNTHVISGNLVEEINILKQSTEKEILLFGSPTAAHALMAEDLIDAYWLNVNPILLTNGIPVFKDLKAQTHLSPVACKVFKSGVIRLDYVRSH